MRYYCGYRRWSIYIRTVRGFNHIDEALLLRRVETDISASIAAAGGCAMRAMAAVFCVPRRTWYGDPSSVTQISLDPHVSPGSRLPVYGVAGSRPCSAGMVTRHRSALAEAASQCTKGEGVDEASDGIHILHTATNSLCPTKTNGTFEGYVRRRVRTKAYREYFLRKIPYRTLPECSVRPQYAMYRTLRQGSVGARYRYPTLR